MNKKISDVLKGTEFEEMVEIFEVSNFKTIKDIELKVRLGGSVAQLLNPIFNEIISDKKDKIKLYGIIQKEVDSFNREHNQKPTQYLLIGCITIPILLVLYVLFFG